MKNMRDIKVKKKRLKENRCEIDIPIKEKKRMSGKESILYLYRGKERLKENRCDIYYIIS